MTPYVSRCRRIWVIACPWVLSLQDLVMRRTRRGEETQHARSPPAPGLTPPRVSPGPFSYRPHGIRCFGRDTVQHWSDGQIMSIGAGWLPFTHALALGWWGSHGAAPFIVIRWGRAGRARRSSLRDALPRPSRTRTNHQFIDMPNTDHRLRPLAVQDARQFRRRLRAIVWPNRRDADTRSAEEGPRA